MKLELNENADELSKEYQKVYGLLEQKNYAKTKREKNSTTEMINDYNSSTRYRRRAESKNLLKGITGITAQFFKKGAWNLISNSLKFEQLQDLPDGGRCPLQPPDRCLRLIARNESDKVKKG